MKKESLIKFYANYKLYIFPAVIAISSLVLIILIIYPQTIKLISNQKAQTNLFTKSKFLEAKAQALENYDETGLSQKVNIALLSYPSDKDFGNTVTLLQTVSSRLGFNISTLTIGSGSNSGNVQSYGLKVEVIGPRSLFSLLLDNIENSNRLLRLSSVEVSNKDAQTVDAVLNIEAFYGPIPTTLGSIDSPLPQISQNEEKLITKLSTITAIAPSQPQTAAPSGPRGKSNPFE